VSVDGNADISAVIAEHRDELPMSDQLPTFDPPQHTDHRALLMKLLTPRRLKENEEFMWRLADRQIDEFAQRGSVEIMSEFAGPFAMLVIADLLGVPERGPPDVPRTAQPAQEHRRRHRPGLDDAQPARVSSTRSSRTTSMTGVVSRVGTC